MRSTVLPYGRQTIDDDDVAAVVAALRSGWLTTGPLVDEFEAAFALRTGAFYAVAVSSGTAALHAAMDALKIGVGHEVIVPAMTFAASANCVVFQGGTPVFADVDPGTFLIDPASVEARITPRTRAILAVDYAGQPCKYDDLRAIADQHGLVLVADAAHSLGATYRGRPVGSLADLNTFSFHPVKHITTGEGGMVTTADPKLNQRLRTFRNHGITTDHHQRTERGGFFYEMVNLGYNYRMTDLQCALGLSQLSKLAQFLDGRRAIARDYDTAFKPLARVVPLAVRADVEHAYHLYPVRWKHANRQAVFDALRAEGIGVNVHYIPVHLHPFYRDRFGTGPGMCPVAEHAYTELTSLPIFPAMSSADRRDVIAAVEKVHEEFFG